MTADVFAPHIEAVAKFFWGDPNPHLSSKSELRWGEHGSRAVDIDKGTFFDHEAKEGGGVLALVKREARREGREAVQYLQETVGCRIEDDRPQRAQDRRIAATYDYQDENGDTLFQVVRFEPKDFRQRRPDIRAEGGWSWSIKGVRQVPYRLPEVIETLSMGGTVFIVEGEKDADALWKQGVAATCNAGGAGKWPATFAEFFTDADVVILPDNDEAGRNHAALVGASMKGVAKRTRVLDLPDLPPKGDVSDWMKAGGGAVDLYRLAESSGRPWMPGAPESRFGAVLWSGLDQVKVRHDWLVEGMLFSGDFGLSYGASQSGKSFLSVDMGLAIARGSPFLGKATRKGAVLYQAGEGGLGLLSRLKAYRKHHALYDDDVPFVLLPARVDLFSGDADNGIDAFLGEIMAFKAWLTEPLAMVVIDTLATATPGANENASEDVSRALRNVQRIQEEARCAVLLVHHKNAAGEKPRGHTSLYANADSALEVIRDENDPSKRTLRVAKVKDGEDGEKIGFRLQSVEIGSYDDGKPITSCVVVPAQEGDRRTGEKPDFFTRNQRFFITVLRQAITEKGGIAPSTVNTPSPYTRVVEWPDFTKLLRRVSNPDDSDEALRQLISRCSRDLATSGMIGRDNGYVWITSKGEQPR